MGNYRGGFGRFRFELLNSRLKGSFDVYNKTTTNVILNTRPYVTSGISNSSPAHVGEYLIKELS
jgi:hypothetical protein